MKMRLLSLVAASLGFAAVSNAAVTVNVRNFSSATVGVPIVNAAGVPIDQGGAFISAGSFDAGFNFNSMTAPQLLALFNPVDAGPLALHATFDGLFTGQDFNSAALPAGMVGQNAYILVMNGATIETSTLIAVYDTATLFVAPDAVGNSSQTLSGLDSAGWVYGIDRAVTVQPSLAGAAFTTGIQMTTIPEPSAMLLGALGVVGLIRRRR